MNHIFYQVSDARFAPIAGNFDPPPRDPDQNGSSAGTGTGSGGTTSGGNSGNAFYNELLPADVNADGLITAQDALLIANFLNTGGVQPTSAVTFAGLFFDTDNDQIITPQDYLLVVHQLQSGEGESATSFSSRHTNLLNGADTTADGIVTAREALVIAIT